MVVPRTSWKVGDRAFSVATPRACNRLPTDLKLLRRTASFKSKLKSFLFHAAIHREHCVNCGMRHRLIVVGALQVTGVTATVCRSTFIRPLRPLWTSTLRGHDAYQYTSQYSTHHEIDSCANHSANE